MLRCDECGRSAHNEVESHGWRAYVATPDDEPEIAVFCPECAEREFGESGDDSDDFGSPRR